MSDIYTFTRKQQSSFSSNSLELEETLFHSANGYIGIRGALEEGYDSSFATIRGSYINGVYDIVDMPQAELLPGLITKKQTMINLSDVQSIKVYADGELCTPLSAGFIQGERSLDMRKGIAKRSLKWQTKKGKTIALEVRRMASFKRPNLFLIEYKVRTDEDISLSFVITHTSDVKNFCDPADPRVAAHSQQHVVIDKVSAKEKQNGLYSSILTHTSRSGIKVVTVTFDSIDAPSKKEIIETKEATVSFFSLKVEKEKEITLNHYAVFFDSLRTEDIEESADEFLSDVLSLSPESLFREQIDYMSDFWSDFDFGIEGDNRLSQAMIFNVFMLLQSVGKDGKCHLAAKGLSGEGYEGHYFWDTEMYVQPLFTLNKPEISKGLLTYRYSILPKARENARILGHKKGALFPWRTINGEECSGFFPAGTAQYHIDGAVAYAIIMYYLVTDDKSFMVSMGLEMLFEISRLWLDLGTYYDGEFQLHCVTGPDEYTCMVNNNFYTNISAKYDLAWTVKLFDSFKKQGLTEELEKKLNISNQEINEFRKASEHMYLPYDDSRDIIPQDDSFFSKKIWDLESTPKEDFPLLMHYHPMTLYRYQVCKQADALLAFFLYEGEVRESTMLNSFRYYEKVTTHDSSLSTCVFSIIASRLGLEEEAYSYLGNSVETDIKNTHGNTKDGIHTANMGGSYMAIVFGFGGFRINENGFFFNPSIPKEWTGYHFSLKLKGKVIRVSVSHESISFSSDEDARGLEIYLYDKKIEVTNEKRSYRIRKERRWQ